MKVKTNELTGAALDWAVAKCECEGFDPDHNPTDLKFSTDWALAGPIIEREKIGVWWATHYVDDDGVEYGNHWYAEPACTDDNADKPYRVAVGPTLLITAMRCYVVNKLGDEIEIPKEVTNE
jgi:hypothetical protein